MLEWPFEWPAIVPVFLPIFYPVVAAMEIDLIWFGTLVTVVLQTAFLSTPVTHVGLLPQAGGEGLEAEDDLLPACFSS